MTAIRLFHLLKFNNLMAKFDFYFSYIKETILFN